MKPFLPWIAWLGSAVVAFAQQIDEPFRVTTLVPTASGDPIGSHAFFDAKDVAISSAGEVFIADTVHSTIRKIAVNGAVSTIAGSYNISGLVDGQGTAARFYSPSSLAIDSAGILYIADTYNSVIRKIASNGMVSTLAGDPAGTPGSTDGVGSEARFNFPAGIAVDVNGFVYVADQGNATIRKITPDGAVTTLAGLAGSRSVTDGQGSAARFTSTRGITADDSGNLYVTDCACVRKISPEGYVTTLAGVGCGWGYVDGTGPNARFNTLEGITTSPNGALFVVDSGNVRIRKISQAGNVTTIAGGYPSQFIGDSYSLDGTGSEARFYLPRGITADSSGLLYVAERRVRTVTPGGVVTTLPAATLFPFPIFDNAPDDAGEVPVFRGVNDSCIDAAGNIYVAEYTRGVIRKITPNGVITTLRPWTRRSDGRKVWQNLNIVALVVDPQGNIFFSESTGIGVVRPTGEVFPFAGDRLSAGSADGIGPAARFMNVRRLILDKDGNLYAGDVYNCNVRKITRQAVVTTLAGSAGNCGTNDGVGLEARFAFPEGLAVDAAGTVYVADSHYAAISNTIRKITTDGAVTTIAGSPGTYGFADGVGASAHFHHPTALALDRSGNILVADSWNHRLRKVTPAGVVTTVAGGDAPYGSIDGIGSGARFGGLTCMVTDSVGNRYIIDGDSIRMASSTLKAHPLNVSTRLQVLENENVLIGGFIVGGTSTKQVILRALGPSLTAYEVSGALSDPLLELYDSGGHLVASNDSWKVNAQTFASQQAAIEATNLAPADDREAALIATLEPQQGYTAIVRGSHRETGVGIVEVYDLNSGTAASLANISTRGFVESGDKVMIGGFILGATNSTAEVLVRALGPSLAQSGIANPLGNPIVQLFNANGELVTWNDNWEETNGAAILVSLPAGAYTAVVRGHDESGVGLIEVYNLH